MWACGRLQALPAHVCYAVAGAAPGFLVPPANAVPGTAAAATPALRFCLLGGDHTMCPRTFASAAALQRTEVF
eukprot:155225-Chlamydomonas_euryale.AAC.1